MRYRWKTGMLAWILFRVTGLLLVVYLAMHISVISSLHNEAGFDRTMNILGAWQFRVLELGLLAVVVYHAMNGVRIFIVDFFNGALYQAKLFWVMMVIGAVLFLAGAYPMFSHTLYCKKHAGEPSHAQVETEIGTLNTTVPAGEGQND